MYVLIPLTVVVAFFGCNFIHTESSGISNPVLRDIHLHIRPGEKISIVGMCLSKRTPRSSFRRRSQQIQEKIKQIKLPLNHIHDCRKPPIHILRILQ
ncbi:hypothetical protein E8L90_15500 [Brevibacillus antibioticus]|uniref:Uncharacterized protein n=1 Tax=Brevibacillus antibioticus TaxID=2570228 RepID=A0A4U2Y7X3_9BACL|nr:hypothetical protein E8L90_15500 [Brevibacillus antibioticus]